jgi:phage terminase large subunit-like protein
MLAFYFAGVIELVIILPKKNGKTTLLAALALYHLLMVESAECVIGASSRDQATILFNQATGLVERSRLDRHPVPNRDRHLPTEYEGVFDVKGGYRVIRFERGRIRVLAADAATADGVIPTLALVDELHRHPSGDLYGVFRDGLGPRHGQMITISTPGAKADSPLGQLRARAQALALEVLKKRRTYTSSDGSFALIEWGLDPKDDVDNLKLVKQANPAPWQTIAELRRRRDSPSTTRAQWLRFACGIWTFGESPWLDPATWDRLAVDIGGVEFHESVWVAVREGAVAIVARRGEEVAARAIIGEHPDLKATERTLLELQRHYDIREVAYDNQAFGRSADLLIDQGLPMAEVPHRPERIAMASVTLHRLINTEQIHHDGDPDLRTHVLAGTTKQTERGWRLVMRPENRALIALALAAHQATQAAPEPPMFVSLGA